MILFFTRRLKIKGNSTGGCNACGEFHLTRKFPLMKLQYVISKYIYLYIPEMNLDSLLAPTERWDSIMGDHLQGVSISGTDLSLVDCLTKTDMDPLSA
jgi:GTPase SAR1 family protein